MNLFANYKNNNMALANSSNISNPISINLNNQILVADDKSKMNESLMEFSKYGSTNTMLTVPKSVRFSLATPFSPSQTQEFQKVKSKIKYSCNINKFNMKNSDIIKSNTNFKNRTSIQFKELSDKLKLKKKSLSFYEIMSNHSKQKSQNIKPKNPKNLKKLFNNSENELNKANKNSVIEDLERKKSSFKIQRLSQDLRNSLSLFGKREEDNVSSVNTPEPLSPIRFKRNSTQRNSVNVSERMSQILTTELKDFNKEAPLPKIRSQFAVTNFFIRNFKAGAQSDVVGSSL
jgi:hypothetical protein